LVVLARENNIHTINVVSGLQARCHMSTLVRRTRGVFTIPRKRKYNIQSTELFQTQS